MIADANGATERLRRQDLSDSQAEAEPAQGLVDGVAIRV
jgi:hypothetical protein